MAQSLLCIHGLEEFRRWKAYTEWPEEKRVYSFKKCQKVLSDYKEQSLFYAFLQFKASQQYGKLREYARSKGILIVGDIPIYVAADSADVWANPTEFCWVKI